MKTVLTLFIMTLIVQPTFSRINTAEGLRFNNDEIINGVDGDMNGTGPHMVFISLVFPDNASGPTGYYRRNCSASIIAPHILLTAAHCFGLDKSEIQKIESAEIYFTLDINKIKPIPFITRKFKTHENFNETKAIYKSDIGYLDNDIALIYFVDKLPKGYVPVDYQKDDDSFLLGQTFRAAGYGMQYDHNDARTNLSSSIGKLMSTKLKFDDNFPDQQIFKTHISASQTTTAICQGDSGGAALIKNPDGKFKLVGINSSSGSSELCMTGKSNFTRVALFKDWISATIAELSR